MYHLLRPVQTAYWSAQVLVLPLEWCFGIKVESNEGKRVKARTWIITKKRRKWRSRLVPTHLRYDGPHTSQSQPRSAIWSHSKFDHLHKRPEAPATSDTDFTTEHVLAAKTFQKSHTWISPLLSCFNSHSFTSLATFYPTPKTHVSLLPSLLSCP